MSPRRADRTRLCVTSEEVEATWDDMIDMEYSFFLEY